MFAGLRGGVARLAEKTGAALTAQGAHLRTKTSVTGLRRIRNRWQVTAGSRTWDFDAVVLAAPAGRGSAVAAHQRALRRDPDPRHRLCERRGGDAGVSGGADAGTTRQRLPGAADRGFSVRGVTFVTQKWEWAARAARDRRAQGVAIVRSSFGRYGDAAVLERTDAELAALARRELSTIAGLPPISLDERVTRWNSALPQYRVGHVEQVTRARDSLVDAPVWH